MDGKMSIREFCRRYKSGDFRSKDMPVQVEAGWDNWICPDEELPRRLAGIWSILKGITNKHLLDNYSVQFRNNCPFYGPLYDTVVFEPLDAGKRSELLFLVNIGNSQCAGKYEVVTARNSYEPEASFHSAREVQRFINGWPSI